VEVVQAGLKAGRETVRVGQGGVAGDYGPEVVVADRVADPESVGDDRAEGGDLYGGAAQRGRRQDVVVDGFVRRVREDFRHVLAAPSFGQQTEHK